MDHPFVITSLVIKSENCPEAIFSLPHESVLIIEQDILSVTFHSSYEIPDLI